MPTYVKHNQAGAVEAICITDQDDPETEPFGPSEPSTHVVNPHLAIAAEIEGIAANQIAKTYLVDVKKQMLTYKVPGFPPLK